MFENFSMLTLGIIMAVMFMIGVAIIFVGHELRDSALEEVEEELAELEEEIMDEDKKTIYRYWLIVKFRNDKKKLKLKVDTELLMKEYYQKAFPEEGAFTVTGNGYRFESDSIQWMQIKKRR